MTSPIGSYTGRLRAELGIRRTGPEPSELTELRHGLQDAAEAYVRHGVARADAERRAVADFGEPAEIARMFGTEIAARRTFRATVTLLLLYPTLLGLWAGYSVLFPGHDADWQVAARNGTVFTLVSGVCWLGAAGAAVLLRLRARRLRLPVQPIVIGCALLGCGSAILIAVLAAITSNPPPSSPAQAHAEWIVQTLSNVILLGLVVAGLWTLRAGHLIRAGSPADGPDRIR